MPDETFAVDVWVLRLLFARVCDTGPVHGKREGGIFRAPHIVQVSRENPSISCGCPCRTKATVLRRGVTFRSVLSFQPLSVLLSSRVARTRFLCSLTRSVYAFNFALCVAMTSFVSLRQPKIFKSIF